MVTRITATAIQIAANATRMTTSTITDSVRRLVNVSRIVVVSHCHGGSTPVHGDAPPKRRRAAHTRPTGASATAAKRGATPAAASRIVNRPGASDQPPPTTCGRPGPPSGRTCTRLMAPPVHARIRAGHGSASRLHLEGDRYPVTDDVDRGDPAVEVVGVEQACRRSCSGGACQFGVDVDRSTWPAPQGVDVDLLRAGPGRLERDRLRGGAIRHRAIDVTCQPDDRTGREREHQHDPGDHR